MTDLKFDENLQPILGEGKDWKTINGRDEFEQWLRLNAEDRLYGITSRYDKEVVPSKIELTINRLARQSDYISSIVEVNVTDLDQIQDQKASGYRVEVKFNEAENVLLNFDGL